MTGALALLIGIVALLPETGLLPARLHDLVFEFGGNDPLGLHLVQEMATLYGVLGVFLGALVQRLRHLQ